MRLAYLSAAFLIATPQSTPWTPSVEIVVSSADPAQPAVAKVQLISGHARVLSAQSGTVTATSTQLVLPARLQLTVGAEIALTSAGVPLTVSSDSLESRPWAVSGPTIRLRYSVERDGKAHVIILEAEEGRITPSP